VLRRRVVEPKDETKRKLGRSPDEMDALNLLHDLAPSPVPRPERRRLEPSRQSMARRLGPFGL
jgi:hypothetical protein